MADSSILQELLKNQDYRNKDGSYNRLRNDSTSQQSQIFVDENLKKIQSLSEILEIAISNNASDIHISAGAPPRFRVNGELRDIRGYAKMTPDVTKRILSEIIADDMVEDFERIGDLDFAHQLNNRRFRCNLYKQRNSWAGVFRLLNDRIPTPNELGLPTSVVELTKKKRGLVLVTGPTGSGKSTTLASLISEINHTAYKNIITLEDPIEYLHKHGMSNVNQREMGVDSKDFASALRASLREDPDVILVGEMRDFETISTAITAAETGHLVFSTLHTIGAAATIDRVIDTYPVDQQDRARSQLATVIEGVVSQQLLKKADGRGRVAAFEVMTGSTAIRNLIREGKTEQMSSMIQTSSKLGMQLLDDCLVDLLKKGLITTEVGMEYSVNRGNIENRLRS